jgi:4-hydroxy-tetrahydrodipicolinate synthase
VPIIVGASAAETSTALGLARHGEESGARAILAAPPANAPANAVRAHYAALAEAVRIPIMIHRHMVPIATPQLLALTGECPNIRYIKEETPDAAGHMITELHRCGAQLEVFSGAKYLLDELARGVVGAVPGSVCVADLVHAYALFVRGDLGGARHAYNHTMPLLFARRQAYLAWSKEVLRRQGIFKTAYVREPGQRMDEYDHRELTAIMDSMGGPF